MPAPLTPRRPPPGRTLIRLGSLLSLIGGASFLVSIAAALPGLDHPDATSRLHELAFLGSGCVAIVGALVLVTGILVRVASPRPDDPVPTARVVRRSDSAT